MSWWEPVIWILYLRESSSTVDLLAYRSSVANLYTSVSHYPEEDTKLRASNIETRRGGNCPNSLDVLQQLIGRQFDNHGGQSTASAAQNRLHLVSCLPRRDSPAAQQVIRSFGTSSPISFQHSIYREASAEAASSYIIRSRATGSRTLVNHNPLAEMTLDEFAAVAREFPAEGTSWWHFEVCSGPRPQQSNGKQAEERVGLETGTLQSDQISHKI